MRDVQPVNAIRDAEQAFFTAHPDVDLMQLAADHVATVAQELLSAISGRVLVVAGPGNNGGDGLFAGVRLARAGVQVRVWPAASTCHEEGRKAAEAAGCLFVTARDAIAGLPDTDLVIDAVLGIGGRPGLTPEVATFTQACADLAIPVLSVDLPSGLAADSHQVVGAHFTATRTVTFAAHKMCHVAQPASAACGRVDVVDMGLDLPAATVRVAELADVAKYWPFPTAASDKYSRGVVGLDTGSQRYPGAGVLSTTGALYAGAGMTRFCGAERSANLIALRMPSVTFGRGRVQAWLVGCGWGPRPDAAARITELADEGVPMVLDADALPAMPEPLPAGCLITPHAGELARLLGVTREQVAADPLGHIRQAAARWDTTVLLKGASQYVASPDGQVGIALAGPHWTAQAGSGDTLAGICATLLASGVDAWWAALLAASVQAVAAARRPGSWPPDRVVEALPEVLAELQQVGGWGT